jgi:hypothetical protein
MAKSVEPPSGDIKAATAELSFITEELRATISKRLAHLNTEMGRTEDWYSDPAESVRAETSSKVLRARAAMLGLEEPPEWMNRVAEKIRRPSEAKRLTVWEFRSTRERYDRHVTELTDVLKKAGMEVRPVVIVEGPTGQITAQILLDKASDVSVAFVEEGLLDFGYQMLTIVISSLPIPEDESEDLAVRVDASAATKIIDLSMGKGQLLRVFEVVSRYLLGEVVKPLESFPVHPLQSLAMAPIWACMESFVVAHEFSHALHGDLHGGVGVFKQGAADENGTPLDLVVLVETLVDHPEHLREMTAILPELQADFEASDLVAALRLKDAGPVAVLIAPLLFLEFIDILELCLLRLAYGRDAVHPAFTGNPSPAVRKAYLMAQMKRRIDAELYHAVETTFLEFQKICAQLSAPVVEQMHILWRNKVPPSRRWSKLVQRMKPSDEAAESTSVT